MCVGDQLWGGGAERTGMLFGTRPSQAEQDKGKVGVMRPLLPVMGDPLISGKRVTNIACEKISPHPLLASDHHQCSHVMLRVYVLVSGGYSHVLMLLDSGEVLSVGDSDFGQVREASLWHWEGEACVCVCCCSPCHGL